MFSAARLCAATLLLSLACADAAAANEGFATSGSMRIRHESLYGQSRPGFRAHDTYMSMRTLLAGEYRHGGWRAFAELQDSRAWFARPDSAISTSEVNALEVAQLYVERAFEAPFGPGSTLRARAGRFAANLGSRRLVAADDYRNTTNSLTGLKLEASTGAGWSGIAWYVMPARRLPDELGRILDNDVALDRESRATTLRGVLLTTPARRGGAALEAGYVRFRETDTARQATRDRQLTNWNLRGFRDPAPGRWDFEFEASLQQGRASTGLAPMAPRLPVDARFLHARLGYQWAGAWKPRVALEYHLASGDAGPGRIRRYDTLFGMRRADHAPSGLYAQVARVNLDAPGLRFEATPDARLDAMLTVQRLRLESGTDAFSTTGVRDPRGASGRQAGTQFDLRLRWWAVPKRLRLELDGVWLDKGRFLRSAPNARPGDTRFISLNATIPF